MTYHHQWMYLRDADGQAYEVFNGARTAAYLKNPTLSPGCAKVSNVLDFGGCEAYAFDPPCDDDSYEILGYSGGYVQFPGVSGNYLSTPDAAGHDITGDITIIARVALDDWTPAATGTVVSKRASSTQNSYRLDIITGGQLRMMWSPDGTDASQVVAQSTLPVAAANGGWMWIAASLDVVDGANKTVKFWASADAAQPSWTQLGTTVTTAGTTSIFNSTSALEIGSTQIGTNALLAGKISHVYIRGAIAASHAKPSPLNQIINFNGFIAGDIPSNTSSTFTSSSFHTFTINRSGGSPTVAVPAVGGGLSPARANHVEFSRLATGANAIEVPDSATFSAPTQLDIRVAITWAPIDLVNRVLITHADPGAVSFAWRLQTSSLGRMAFLTSTTGAGATSTVVSSARIADTEDLFLLRVTWRSSDGRVQFFNKPTTPDTIDADKASNTGWTQVGSNLTASTAALFNSTAPLYIGNNTSASLGSPWSGSIYAASVATTIDGPPVVDIQTDNWPRVDDVPTFPIETGQIATVTRAASGPQLDFVFAELDDWDVLPLFDPMFDQAPWYSEEILESADVLGFFIEEWTGLDNRHTSRSVTRTGRPGGGGQLGLRTSAERVMKFNVLVMGLNERALEYAFQWVAGRLGSACASCATSSLLLRRFCPTVDEDLWTGVAELREVGLVEDVAWENAPVENAGCFIRRLSFTIAAGDPCMYSSFTDESALASSGTMATCLTALPIGAGKADCRPMCSDLPASCRNVFTFEVPESPGAYAPIVTLFNDSAAPVVPLRLICYADPNDVGVAPNPCGLQILGEIYTQVIPPWTEVVWDVAARKVLYSDASTVGLEGGFRLMDAVDPPHSRFFVLPCGTSHIVVEPATTCLTRDAPNSRYTYGGYIFDDALLHFPTMSLRLQERMGCA